MSDKISLKTQIFWDEFIKSRPDLIHIKSSKIDAWAFGNSKEMADELSALVLEGKKTATSSLLNAYIGYEDELPQIGTYSVILDGDENPVCIIFQTSLFLFSFNEVTEKHAFDEGEGDRSLEYWRKVHIDFFSSYDNFTEEDTIVGECFEVVYK